MHYPFTVAPGGIMPQRLADGSWLIRTPELTEHNSPLIVSTETIFNTRVALKPYALGIYHSVIQKAAYINGMRYVDTQLKLNASWEFFQMNVTVSPGEIPITLVPGAPLLEIKLMHL